LTVDATCAPQRETKRAMQGRFDAGVEHFARPALAQLVIDGDVFDETITRLQRWAEDPAPFVRALIEAPDARRLSELSGGLTERAAM
jgi:hypothetical protein